MAVASEDLDRAVAAKIEAAKTLNYVHRAEYWEQQAAESARDAKRAESLNRPGAAAIYRRNEQLAADRARSERKTWVLVTLGRVRERLFAGPPRPEEFPEFSALVADFAQVRDYLEKQF